MSCGFKVRQVIRGMKRSPTPLPESDDMQRGIGKVSRNLSATNSMQAAPSLMDNSQRGAWAKQWEDLPSRLGGNLFHQSNQAPLFLTLRPLNLDVHHVSNGEVELGF